MTPSKRDYLTSAQAKAIGILVVVPPGTGDPIDMRHAALSRRVENILLRVSISLHYMCVYSLFLEICFSLHHRLQLPRYPLQRIVKIKTSDNSFTQLYQESCKEGRSVNDNR
jgi:hypothetical protein